MAKNCGAKKKRKRENLIYHEHHHLLRKLNSNLIYEKKESFYVYCIRWAVDIFLYSRLHLRF